MFRPPRRNEARVLLLMDVGGSMDPYARTCRAALLGGLSLNHWRKFEAYSFHNCVYEALEPGTDRGEGLKTADLLLSRPPETFLIFVGDAYMAPSELTEPFGAIDYYKHNKTAGIVWLHRLRKRFARCAWLNPIPATGWHGWTIRLIGQLIDMFPLTVEGLDAAIDHLMKKTPQPVKMLGEMYPEFDHLRDAE